MNIALCSVFFGVRYIGSRGQKLAPRFKNFFSLVDSILGIALTDENCVDRNAF